MSHERSRKHHGWHSALADILRKYNVVGRIPFFSSTDIHTSEIIKGTSVAFSLKILGAAISFGFNILLARMLGAEGAGVYFLILTLVIFGTVIGRLGFDNTILRFVATGHSEKDWPSIKGVYKKSFIYSFSASIVMALALYSLSPWLSAIVFSKPDLNVPLKWMSLAIVPVTIAILYSECLKGLKHIGKSQIINGVAMPALTVLGLLLVGNKYGVTGVAWAYVFSAFVTCLIGYLWWSQATPQIKGIKGDFSTEKLFNSSLPLFLVSVMNLILNWTPIILLGIWGTMSEVGIFGAASRTAMLISFILISVNSIAAPKFAALYREKNHTALSSTARNATKLITVLAFPLFLLFISAPAWVMGIFGHDFKEGAMLLMILATGQFINVATGPVGNLLMMSGNERLLSKIVSSIALVNIILNLLLIPKTGPLGAAIVTATCLASLNLISAFFVWSRLKVITIPFIWSKSYA